MSVKKVEIAVVSFFFLIGLGLASYMNTYETAPVIKSDDLYKTIEENKSEYERPAEDAWIDSVWKKTPGINGRIVDVQASYEKMKKEGKFNEKLLVYKIIKPEVMLKDLPASPIYRGHPDKEMVSFLINVSWGEAYIPDMVETLSEYQVKANFFIDGVFAKEFTPLIRMIEEEGHTIGSHGYAHKDMAKMSKQQAKDNMELADEFLFALTNQKVHYFAPPSGSFTNHTVEAAADLEMETILWTVDTIDWKKPTEDVLVERVRTKLHNGATILMHPTEVTAKSLPALIEMIRKEGYRIGSIDQLLSPAR
ncbi:hypothetical protein EQV77_03890 [Halobacillus fulvus]|nr:hypothetical protein EQV77_03890 [Halobacillus fulvus]